MYNQQTPIKEVNVYIKEPTRLQDILGGGTEHSFMIGVASIRINFIHNTNTVVKTHVSWTTVDFKMFGVPDVKLWLYHTGKQI
jgi:hypothetical protein